MMYWTVQGLWVFMTLLPVLLLNYTPSTAAEDGEFRVMDFAGLGLWGLGFGIEALADAQKSAWARLPANKGRFITSGLWALSRHPNYCGEILLWLGLFITCSSRFAVPLDARWLTVVSPAFVYFLLTRVSGIPILERMGLKRWGAEAAYKQYLKQTPVLFPSLARLFTGKQD